MDVCYGEMLSTALVEGKLVNSGSSRENSHQVRFR
jgi:hypothetical protein